MTAITTTDLNNAKLDADHFAAIATSPALTATDRLGQQKRTLAGINAAAQEVIDGLVDVAAAVARQWPSTAAGIGLGVQGTASLVGGSGGTNGTFALAFSGGTQVVAPTGRFVVAGGALVSVTIDYPGYYSAGTPTISLAASAGLTGASVLAVMGPNTPVGAYFGIDSSTDGYALDVYQVTAGPVATYRFSTPSSTQIDKIAARPAGFIVAPAPSSPLARLLKTEIYASVNGVAVTLPAQLCVRECGRDLTFGGRTRLRFAGFDGPSTYSVLLRERGNGTYLAGSKTGQVWVDLEAASTELGFADGTLLGRSLVDFGADEAFGTYAATIDYSDGGIYPSLQQSGPRFTADVSELIAANSMLTTGLKLPFVDELANDYLRSIFKEIALYQVDKSHTYVIGGVEFNRFPGPGEGLPLTRVILTIRDITDGVDVCRFSAQTGDGSTLAEFLATLPPAVKFQQDSLTGYTGVYAVVKVDWSKAVATSTTYTTSAQAGINPRCLFGDDDLGDYLDRDHAHEVIEVGAGKAFATLRAAVESLYISPDNHECHRAHYGHRIRIRLVDDGTFNATLLDIPEFVEVWGNGRGRTTIKRENTNTDAMLEAHLDSKFRHCTIYSQSSEYCVHHDDFNRKSISTAGKHVRTIRQSLKDVDLIGGPSNNVWLYGCGLSSGEELLFENVYAAHEKVDATDAAFGFHNSGPTLSVPSLGASKRPATVRFFGCQTPDPSGVGLYLQTLEDGPTNIVSLINSHLGVVYETVASGGEVLPDLARNRFGYAIGGVYWGPLRRVDPEGATVLATTAGAAVSGTAAALIFGTVDELGRGEMWIRNGTTKSLGARLGDCSSVNKTLTIGGVTCTFSTNLTAASNSTIIAAINAAIPLNPVAEVDIQKELYPDAAPSMRLLNSTGSTLARGLFVSRSGATTAIPANGVSRVFGFVPRPILTGLSGRIVISRQIHSDYIPGASTDGEFGVTAGALDYAATPKVGRVEAGIVILY